MPAPMKTLRVILSSRNRDLIPVGARAVPLETVGRELVGRPFLRDHASGLVAPDASLFGPVHIVVCHKSCTESQLVGFMGHPGLFMVAPPFGFFVVGRVTFVQAFFLANCRDETTTRVACQRMFEWLDQSGELGRLVERAESRARILQAMATEITRAAVLGGPRRWCRYRALESHVRREYAELAS